EFYARSPQDAERFLKATKRKYKWKVVRDKIVYTTADCTVTAYLNPGQLPAKNFFSVKLIQSTSNHKKDER
ncbi:MAG: hypothetical protein PHE45_09145, partial [Bacteroidales bacterium]|nr:hypothetical protein [Bacteroidales bacterium]